jgi:glycolate oxidase FAD binding subunit
VSGAAAQVDALARQLRGGGPVVPRGGGTKTALSRARASARVLDVGVPRGILEYDPQELTFTARAGTTLAEIADTLAEHGQHLPFDPLLVDAGATLGGSVASGAAGAGSHRRGGLRDFVLGVRMLDGTGRLVRGGGKVVKNAAGFDLPKLAVGSIGRLGVLVELTLKVLPTPPATCTLTVDLDGFEAALGASARLALGPFELDACELLPPGGRICLRLAGPPEAHDRRVARIEAFLQHPCSVLDAAAEAALWREARELTWHAPDTALVKVACGRTHAAALDAILDGAGAARRYGGGGRSAWVAWPHELGLAALDEHLRRLGVPGIALLAAAGGDDAAGPLLGRRDGGTFASRVRSALDPDARLLEV